MIDVENAALYILRVHGIPVVFYVEQEELKLVESSLLDLGLSWVTCRFVPIDPKCHMTIPAAQIMKVIRRIQHT